MFYIMSITQSSQSMSRWWTKIFFLGTECYRMWSSEHFKQGTFCSLSKPLVRSCKRLGWGCVQSGVEKIKSYIDVIRKGLVFEVGNKVCLKVASMNGILRFRWNCKLSPCFIGPFNILNWIGPVADKLALPQSLFAIYNICDVIILHKYLDDLTHIIDYESL